MISFSVGPLAVPVAPLLLLVSLWVAARLVRRLAPVEVAARADNALWLAAILGLLGARASHLLLYANAYLAHPWAMLDLRDGGWRPPAGLFLGGGWLAWRAWAMPSARRALVLATLAGVGLWLAVQAAFFVAGGGHARSPVPDLMLTDLGNGRLVRLRDLTKGHPTVINLWASWCRPCRAAMPTLAEAQQGTPGIRFPFVNQGEMREVVTLYLMREGLDIDDVWLDPGSTLGPAVGSSGLPTTLFFTAQGELLDAHFGIINAAALQAKLQDLIERRPEP